MMNNSISLPNGSGSVADPEICYKASTRIDQKRPHQGFMGSSEQELFLFKNQAVESFKGTAVLGSSLWHDCSHFQSESQTASLFNPKHLRSSHVPDNNSILPVTASRNIENKDLGNHFGNDPSICLTMSHAVNCSLSLSSGTMNVKVNEVKISENCLPEFAGRTIIYGERNEIMTSTFQRTGHNVFSEPTYNAAVGNAMLMDPSDSRMDKNFVSVGSSTIKSNGNFMLTNQYNYGIDISELSVGQASHRRNHNINSLGEQYVKENSNFSSIFPTQNKFWESLFILDPFYCQGPNKGERHIAFHGQQEATVASLGALYSKENSSILSMVEHSQKGKEIAISSAGLQNGVGEGDHSCMLVGSHDVLQNQSTVQSSGVLGQKDSMDLLRADAITSSSSRVKNGGARKKTDKKTKKRSLTTFPSNVKSLLSTGILDGVPVKYVSWSREKSLRALVKKTGYLCSCQDCKLSKTISADEFERHAGCKTKHPNSHIHFENGKSIYAVVQELKSTPQENLFDVIQNITGSAVNEKHFTAWKASYGTPTPQLRLTSDKDDLVAPS